MATFSLAGATAGAAAAVDGAETIGTIALMTKAQVAVVILQDKLVEVVMALMVAEVEVVVTLMLLVV